jgi:hypothetical protein
MALAGATTSRAATVEALEPAETFCVDETEFALLGASIRGERAPDQPARRRAA